MEDFVKFQWKIATELLTCLHYGYLNHPEAVVVSWFLILTDRPIA